MTSIIWICTYPGPPFLPPLIYNNCQSSWFVLPDFTPLLLWFHVHPRCCATTHPVTSYVPYPCHTTFSPFRTATTRVTGPGDKGGVHEMAAVPQHPGQGGAQPGQHLGGVGAAAAVAVCEGVKLFWVGEAEGEPAAQQQRQAAVHPTFVFLWVHVYGRGVRRGGHDQDRRDPHGEPAKVRKIFWRRWEDALIFS